MSVIAKGTAFHKAARTLIRAVEPSSPRAFKSTFDEKGFIVPPPLGPAEFYIEMQGITSISLQVNDNNQDIRVFSDEGWFDGSVVSSQITASVNSFFMKELEFIEGWAPGRAAALPPSPDWQNAGIACFIPDRTISEWERGFNLILKARFEKDIGRIASDPSMRYNRIYIEILKEIGTENGDPGANIIYDFVGFEALVSNYSENQNTEGLTEVSYDLVSCGEPSIGKFTAGTEPPKFLQNWNFSDFRDAVTKDSICKFGPEYTAILANTLPVVEVLNALYNNETGETIILVSSSLHFGPGRFVRLFGLAFGCLSGDSYNSQYFPRPQDPNEFEILALNDRPVREFRVTQATYNNETGIAVLTLDGKQGIKVSEYISLSGLKFSCLSSGEAITKEFPQEFSQSYFPVLEIQNNQITINVGPSDFVHTYVGGGRALIGPELYINVGVSDIVHFYINDGSVTLVPRFEPDGTLTYNNADVNPRESSVFAVDSPG
jgi:hypothetical protein